VPQVLALASSPRKGGNSDKLLDACLEPIADAGISFELIRVCDLNISPCINCGGCEKEGECVIDDDMRTLYTRFEESPTLVVSAPVFFMGLPAQLKAVIDRCQAIWVRKYLLRRRMPEPESRRSYFIHVGGMKKDKMFDGGLASIAPFFATLDYGFPDTLLLTDIDARGAVDAHPTALKDAARLGRRIVSEIERHIP
jgi:multimeric flavodoxin WrbA